MANYCERKNQKLAVRSFQKSNVPGSTLVFIGSELGAYGREARRMAEEPGQNASACHIMFLEKLTRAETFAACKATDLVLLTATVETQSLGLIHFY